MNITLSADIKSSFCAPLPGKPDSKKPFDPASGEERPRVPQPPQKGDGCLYYALQILRDEKRIGKYPLPSQMKARAVEKDISAHRKAIFKVEERLKFIFYFAHDIASERGPSNPLTRKEAIKMLLSPDLLIYKNLNKCIDALTTFCKQEQYDDFLAFAEERYYEAIKPVHDKFLKKFNATDDVINTISNAMFSSNYSQLSTFYKISAMNSLVFLSSYEVYGCKHSPWHPNQPITSLIEQLNSKGRHLVSGHIGVTSYVDEPFELGSKLEGRPVFGWKPNAIKTDEMRGNFHAVVIVVAKVMNGKEYVYFIDPVDGSGLDVTSQKVYVMSYEKFRSSISTLACQMYKTPEGKYVYQDEKEINNYALYMPKRV